MHKVVFLLGFLFLSVVVTAAPPKWYKTYLEGRLETDYPKDKYIVGVGKGATEEEAKAGAMAELSLFFEASVDYRSVATHQFNQVGNQVKDGSSVGEQTVIQSNVNFLGLQFATPYSDAKSKEVAVLAYLDKNKSRGLYQEKIASSLTTLNALEEQVTASEEIFRSFLLQKQAVEVANEVNGYRAVLLAIDPDLSTQYAAVPTRLEGIKAVYLQIQNNLTMILDVKGEGMDNLSTLKVALQQNLEQQGFLVKRGQALYRCEVLVVMEDESRSNQRTFLRPSYTITIGDEERVLFSYNKKFNNVTNADYQGALNKAMMVLLDDVKNNFKIQ